MDFILESKFGFKINYFFNFPLKNNIKFNQKMDIENSVQTSESSKKTRLQKRNSFNLHCLGFMNYQPSAIHCLSFNPENSCLLVARSNSTIELRSIPKYSTLYTIRLNAN